jgi:uncharacterized membrane protein
MAADMESFVADKLWLLIAIVTLPLTALCAILGGLVFPPLAAFTPVVPIIGWFLLTPVFLFFGDELAALLSGGSSEGSDHSAATDSEDDPIANLKRRYAEGKIDDAEFERRLERLLAADEDGIDPRGSTIETSGTERDSNASDGAESAADLEEVLED